MTTALLMLAAYLVGKLYGLWLGSRARSADLNEGETRHG